MAISFTADHSTLTPYLSIASDLQITSKIMKIKILILYDAYVYIYDIVINLMIIIKMKKYHVSKQLKE